jgi:hypothetical protein
MSSADREGLRRMRQRISALPQLKGWRVGIYRDHIGASVCSLDHRLGRLDLRAMRPDDDAAQAWFVEVIPKNWLVAHLNSAPPVHFRRLPANLQAGVSLYMWPFRRYCEILQALWLASTISAAERDWLLTGALTDPTISSIRHGPRAAELAPWMADSNPSGFFALRRPRRSVRIKGKQELSRAASDLAGKLGRGWRVRAARSRNHRIEFTINNDLTAREVEIRPGAIEPNRAVTLAANRLRRSAEWRYVNRAPKTVSRKLLGNLRLAASLCAWQPSLLYQVLERLSVAGAISGHEVLWVMRAGPVGNPGWNQNTDRAIRADLAEWRRSVYPEWRAWERSEAASVGRHGGRAI